MLPFSNALLLAGAAGSLVTVNGAPQYFAESNNQSSVTTNASVTYPAGIQANDIAVLILNYAAASGSPTFTDPVGWTNEFSQNFGASSHYRQTAWSKRLTGSESGTVTIPVSVSIMTCWTAHLLVYRGCSTSGAVIENIAGTSKSVSSAIALTAAPIYDVTGPDRTVVHCHFAFRSASQPAAPTSGTGYTQRSTTGSSSHLRTSIHEKAKTTPGYENEVAEYGVTIDDTWACVYLSLIPQTVVSSSTPVRVDANLTSNVLLLGFNGLVSTTALLDEMSVGRTISRNGNAQISNTSPMFGSAMGLFDGSGDWYNSTDSADWDFSTGAFTVEAFVKFTTKQDSQAIIGQWDNAGTASNCAWFLYITGGKLRFRIANGSTNIDNEAAFIPALGTRYHIAVDRDGTKTRVYINGALSSSSTSQQVAPNNSTANFTIGAIGNTDAFPSLDFNGNIDEVRITKGVARYASDAGFTAPSVAFPRS